MSTNRFLTLINGVPRRVQAIASSIGVADANKIVATNANGKIDPTLIDSLEPQSWQTISLFTFNQTNGTVGNGWENAAGSGTSTIDAERLRLDRASGLTPLMVRPVSENQLNLESEVFWIANATFGVTVFNRLQTVNTYYSARIYGSGSNLPGIYINKVINGVETQFGSAIPVNPAIANGTHYSILLRAIDVNPTTLYAEVKTLSGQVIGSATLTDSDPVLQQSGRIGVCHADDGQGFIDRVIVRQPATVPNRFENTDLVLEYSDHFFYQSIANGTNIGALGLQATLTGATINGIVTPFADYPGVIAIDTGAIATNHGILRSAPGSIRFGECLYRFKKIVRVPILPTAAEAFTVNIGFGDAASGNGAIVDGARFTCNQANPNWFAITSSNSNSTGTNTNTNVPVNTNFNVFEVEVDRFATKVNYFINGVLVATHTTNIPIGAGRETGLNIAMAKTAGTTARQLQIDFAKLRMDMR
jgi:hypothetical protein